MKFKFLYFILFISPFFIHSQEVIQITCDEEIKLEIDEVNMTNEEIVKAKDVYFQKLLAQANQECISQAAQTDDLSVTQTNSGGSVSGSSSTYSFVYLVGYFLKIHLLFFTSP